MSTHRNRKISWMIVGLGLQGHRLAEAIRVSKNSSLVAVVSKDKNRAKKFAEEFSVARYYDSLPKALKNASVSAVCVASRNDKHATQVIQALRAGKDVLCEKPLALNIKDGRSIAQESKLHHAQCFVDFQLRQHPAVLRARELISHGALGKISYIEMQWSIGSFREKKLPVLPSFMRWRENTKQAGGGALMARGVHLFDLLRFLTGKEVSEVRAYTDARAHTVDRIAIGILILEDNTPALITTGKQIPETQNRILLYGNEGRLSLELFDNANTLMYLSPRKTIKKIFPPINLYAAVFDSFKNTGGENTNATIFDGAQTITITEAFQKSAQQGRAVRLLAKK